MVLRYKVLETFTNDDYLWKHLRDQQEEFERIRPPSKDIYLVSINISELDKLISVGLTQADQYINRI